MVIFIATFSGRDRDTGTEKEEQVAFLCNFSKRPAETSYSALHSSHLNYSYVFPEGGREVETDRDETHKHGHQHCKKSRLRETETDEIVNVTATSFSAPTSVS